MKKFFACRIRFDAWEYAFLTFSFNYSYDWALVAFDFSSVESCLMFSKKCCCEFYHKVRQLQGLWKIQSQFASQLPNESTNSQLNCHIQPLFSLSTRSWLYFRPNLNALLWFSKNFLSIVKCFLYICSSRIFRSKSVSFNEALFFFNSPSKFPNQVVASLYSSESLSFWYSWTADLKSSCSPTSRFF